MHNFEWVVNALTALLHISKPARKARSSYCGFVAEGKDSTALLTAPPKKRVTEPAVISAGLSLWVETIQEPYCAP